MRARSSVPERNKVRLRSFHTSLIDNYENRKRFECDMNLPWGACAPIILHIYISVFPKSQGRTLQHQRNVIESFVHEMFFYIQSKSKRAFFLSFCDYHTLCVETSVRSQRPFSWAFWEYHSGCGWVNVYVCERLFGPKGSFLLERQSHSGSLPDQRSMLLEGKFLWKHFAMKERTTLLNQYSLFCSITEKVHTIQR